MRHALLMLPLLLGTMLIQPSAAHADATGEGHADASGEARAGEIREAAADGPAAPAMRVICTGDAMAPGLLRHTFQSAPETRYRPEVIRTAARRQPARQAAPAPPIPVLWLPCISG